MSGGDNKQVATFEISENSSTNLAIGSMNAEVANSIDRLVAVIAGDNAGSTIIGNQNELEVIITSKLDDLKNILQENAINDISANNLNFGNLVSAIDRKTQIGISFNEELKEIHTKQLSIDASFINILDKNSNTDISLTNILDKHSNTDISLTNILDKQTDIDISLAIIADKLLNVEMSNNSISLKLIDNIAELSTTTEDRFRQLSVQINPITTTDSNTFLELLTQLNVDDVRQNQIVSYIGEFILLPIYETRLYDITSKYYNRLQSDVICIIDEYLKLYNKKNFQELSVSYSITQQNDLANKVYNISQDGRDEFINFSKIICDAIQNSPTTSPELSAVQGLINKISSAYDVFQRYIAWAYKTLDGLTQTRYIYNEYNTLNDQVEKLKIDSEILNNPEKLSIYIEQYNRNKQSDVLLFQTTATFNFQNLMGLKPQYAEYIKRYGFPDNFYFESDKMADVIYDLTKNNIISADDEVSVECSSEISSSINDGQATYFVFISTNDLSGNYIDTDGTLLTDGINTNPLTTIPTNLSSMNVNGLSDTPSPVDFSNVYFYPLYTTKELARNSYSESGATDTSYSILTTTGTDPSTVEISFPHLTDISFWMPTRHPYLSYGILDFYPSTLNYIHYTENTVLEHFTPETCDKNTYYVYISNDDKTTYYSTRYDIHGNSYYYPLFTTLDDASKNNNIKYNADKDVSDRTETSYEQSDDANEIEYTFEHLQKPGLEIKLWQPRKGGFRSKGKTNLPPPILLNYIHYSKYRANLYAESCTDTNILTKHILEQYYNTVFYIYISSDEISGNYVDSNSLNVIPSGVYDTNENGLGNSTITPHTGVDFSNTYFYPLYTSREKALEAYGNSGSNPSNSILSIEDDISLVEISFPHLSNEYTTYDISFWMPSKHQSLSYGQKNFTFPVGISYKEFTINIIRMAESN